MIRRITALVALLGIAVRCGAVDFEREILPMLKESCLACHNQTKAKADLVLETPQTILKGGESGPAVIPGKPEESLLFKVASHREKPVMPPKDNKVNAPDLTAAQLRQLALWIAEGATGEVHAAQTIVWQTLSRDVRPILSLALTDDGQFAACGRGNELLIYQLPTKRTVVLSDPKLSSKPAAHLDLVQALDFSPDGQWLASGSYREVKLWKRQPLVPQLTTNVAPATNATELLSPDGKWKATAGTNHTLELASAGDSKSARELKGDYESTLRVATWERARNRATNHLAYRRAAIEKAQKEREAQTQRVRKASDALGVAEKALSQQTNDVNAARAEEGAANKELAAAGERLKQAQENAAKLGGELTGAKAALKELEPARVEKLLELAAKLAIVTNELPALKIEAEKNEKPALEKVKAAQKRVADAEAVLKRGQITNSAAENELTFAISAAQAAADALIASQNQLQVVETDLKAIDSQLAASRSAWSNTLSRATGFSFSADSSCLAAVHENGSVTVWATAEAAPLHTIHGNATNAWFVDSTLFTQETGRTEAWDLNPDWSLEKVIDTVSGQPAFADRVNTVRFSPDGQLLATGGGEPTRSGEVKIWRVRDGELLHDLKNLHSDAVLCLAFSPDGRYLASGGADRFAKITELASWKLLRVLEGHTHHVLALDWKADGHTLVTAGADNTVKCWDAFSGEKRKSPEPFNKEVTAIAYLGGTDQVVASCGDASLRVFKDNTEKVRLLEGAKGYLQAAIASRDGSTVLAGGDDGVLRIWQVDSGKLSAELPAQPQ